MAVEKGNTIKVEYEGKLEDGTIFDSSEKQGQPLQFEAGNGKVVKGFDEAVLGMELNEEKEITLTPENAYGSRKEEMVIKLPRSQFPQDKELKKGMMFIMGTPQGHQLPAVIMDAGENEVTVDMNHPLAGKTLIFKVKVVEINQ
jgi:peptidylprolyl isomerase